MPPRRLPRSSTSSNRTPWLNQPSSHGKKICKLCNNLSPEGHIASLHDPETNGLTLSLNVDPDRLDRCTREAKCRFCGVVAKTLDGFCKGWREKVGVMIGLELGRGEVVGICVEGLKRDGEEERCEIYVPDGTSRSPWPGLGTKHTIPSHSGSDDSIDFVKRCLHDCINNSQHSACHISTSDVPSRLIDVSGDESADVKIWQTRSKKDINYAALSHCWGSDLPVTTTTENIRSRKSNIPWDTLPPLFQDAVTITRRLGLRYLWIDSLCILQDSRSDWVRESARMGSIYEGAYVTIAATTASNSSERFLIPRAKPVSILYENTNGKKTVLKARKTLNHHPRPADKAPACLQGALVTRAWALQEHVLCSRIIHYTATELIFECRTAFRCECRRKPKRWPTTPGLIPKALSSSKTPKSKPELWKTWHRIVTQYSNRQLTFTSDKLPAISGIAGEFASATKSDYICGLWRDNLALDLLWASNFDTTDQSNAYALAEYRAPSFSWASLDVPVTYHHSDEVHEHAMTPAIDVKGTSCEMASEHNLLGEIKSASLILAGYLLEATLFCSKKVEATALVYHLHLRSRGTSKSSTIVISPDTLLIPEESEPTSSQSQEASSSPNENKLEASFSVRRARPGEEQIPFNYATVYCLKVATHGHDWISGLVLAPASGSTFAAGKSHLEEEGSSVSGLSTFTRLGKFECSFESFSCATKRSLVLI